MDGSLDTAKPTLDLASYTRQQHAFERLEAQITNLWGHLNAAPCAPPPPQQRRLPSRVASRMGISPGYRAGGLPSIPRGTRAADRRL